MINFSFESFFDTKANLYELYYDTKLKLNIFYLLNFFIHSKKALLRRLKIKCIIKTW